MTPIRPRRPCTVPGCPELVRKGSRCEAHAGQPTPCRTPTCPGWSVFRGICSRCLERQHRELDARRPAFKARGYGAAWRALRGRVLRANPRCPCGQPATEVDHVRPLASGGANELGNLQALCRSCHSSKTAGELNRRRAGGVAP